MGATKAPCLSTSFETISVGISRNLAITGTLSPTKLKHRIIDFKQRPKFVNNTGAGANIKSKLQSRMDFAISFFSKA